jgi:hypothetical protein
MIQANKKVIAVIPNYGGEAFIKVLLDQQSLAYVKNNICKIKDDLTRCLMWYSLSEMVKDGIGILCKDFVQLCCDNLKKETNNLVL